MEGYMKGGKGRRKGGEGKERGRGICLLLNLGLATPLDMTKTFWCVFRFTILTVVHLQNANAKFHKVGYRHYSGKAENVYISVLQIYSAQYVPNFITIGQVL